MEDRDTGVQQAVNAESPVSTVIAVASLAIRAIVAALLIVIFASVTSLLAAVVSELNETEGMLIDGQAITLVGAQLWIVRVAWVLLAFAFALAIAHRAAFLLGAMADDARELLCAASVATSRAGGIAAAVAVYWPAVQSFFVDHAEAANSVNPVALSVACIVAWVASVNALTRLSNMFAPAQGGEPFAHVVALSIGSWVAPIPFGVVAVLVAAVLSLFVGGLPAIIVGIFVLVVLMAVMFTW